MKTNKPQNDGVHEETERRSGLVTKALLDNVLFSIQAFESLHIVFGSSFTFMQISQSDRHQNPTIVAAMCIRMKKKTTSN
jgi:hypothetical protein